MRRIFASQATLHKLEIFSMVCEFQSVTRVAERIGIAQPVVTAHLRFLEEKLGVTLFVRQGRRIVLTSEGERVLIWANEVITRTRELERELAVPSEEGAGSVVVAASMTVGSYVLPALFARFRHANPLGVITVNISNPQLVTAALRDGSADFGVCILDPRLDVDGLDVQRLWQEQLVLVVAPDSDIVGARATPAEICHLPFVTSPRNQVRREIEEDDLRAYGVVRERIVLEFGHPEAMKQAVRNHAGVAFVMETSVRDELARGLLRKVDTPELDLPIPIFLVSRGGKRFSALQSQLLTFVREAAVGDRPPA